MEKLHTPEPWELCSTIGTVQRTLVGIKGEGYIDMVAWMAEGWDVDEETQKANARRIVACVNACAGIPSEKLDGLATMARLGIELTDAINDPDGRFNRLEKEHYANEFSLEKAGITGEMCETNVSKGIEILTAQRDSLLSALRALYGWQRAEVEHFGATTPDDFIIEMVEKALKNA